MPKTRSGTHRPHQQRCRIEACPDQRTHIRKIKVRRSDLDQAHEYRVKCHVVGVEANLNEQLVERKILRRVIEPRDSISSSDFGRRYSFPLRPTRLGRSR